MSFPKEGIVPISMLDTLTRLVVEIKSKRVPLLFQKEKKNQISTTKYSNFISISCCCVVKIHLTPKNKKKH
jgi:hypothetical protein